MCVSLCVLGKIWIRSAGGCRGEKTTLTTVHVCIVCIVMVGVTDRHKTLPAPQKCDDGRQHTLTLNVMESLIDEYPK